MPTITVQLIGDRLAVLHNSEPCLWVAGGQAEWQKYVQKKEAEGFCINWKA